MRFANAREFMEENESGVTEAVAEPEIELEATQTPEVEAIETEVKSKPKGKDENMARMRQSLDDLAKQNRELQQALQQMQKGAKPEKPEVDELEGVANDDFVNRSQAEKLIERKVQARVDAALKALKLETREGLYSANNSDYKQIVNQENFEALFQDVPELQPVLKRVYELAQKGEDLDPVALSYKLLKKVGYGSKGESEMAKQTVNALEKNQNKPKSSNTIKSSALSEAHTYMNKPTKEESDRLFKETQAAARARR